MKEKLNYIGLGIVIGWIIDYAFDYYNNVLKWKKISV